MLVAFKNEMFSAGDAEDRINIINGDIKKIEADLLQNTIGSKDLIQKQQDLFSFLLDAYLLLK
ncbi:hypothetical protein [Paenibacillus terrae]|uniref:hypothetical protein n=1 Tax=Paenibacillus terrae TaxID=159743 RepID=UPI0011EB86BB|nr:hypothetical protein [Paenibacillus terrae]